MKFVIDNQLPIALAIHFRHLGHDCAHVIDLNLDETDDADLWTYCTRSQNILISKDDDFLFLANRPGDAGRLAWVRLGNCRNAALIAAFNRIHDSMIQAFQSGQRIVEVR